MGWRNTSGHIPVSASQARSVKTCRLRLDFSPGRPQIAASRKLRVQQPVGGSKLRQDELEPPVASRYGHTQILVAVLDSLARFAKSPTTEKNRRKVAAASGPRIHRRRHGQ